ncbi:hypothetical protein [Thermus sediminis]|uniref:hypothetical protein n=1 Tax=Thermus sediminis TaxID=1761908 RepID=UPI001E59FFDD|nr:hypothetical protein [Thermus sediminis]
MRNHKDLKNRLQDNQAPAFADPALEILYRSWLRNRDRAPDMVRALVEAYARTHGLSVADLLRRFAEAEAREAPQALASLRPTREEILARPPTPERVETPLEVADHFMALGEQRGTLPPLTKAEMRVYRFLLALGLERLARTLGPGRPVPQNLSQVVVFVPNDALRVVLGLPSSTFYLVIGRLKEKGLIVGRPWRVRATLRVKGAYRSGVYAAGVVYAVRMPHRSRRPRLEREDFDHPWRDLEGDVAQGRTAWKLMGSVGESYRSPLKGDTEALGILLDFSLSPGERTRSPLAIDSPTALLRAKGGRRQRVEALARALAEEFRDPGSVRFYAHLFWGALRLEDYGLQEGALRVVEWAIGRVREAVATTGLSRRRILRPGALLASLLKREGLLDQIRQAPQWRVA